MLFGYFTVFLGNAELAKKRMIVPTAIDNIANPNWASLPIPVMSKNKPITKSDEPVNIAARGWVLTKPICLADLFEP